MLLRGEREEAACAVPERDDYSNAELHVGDEVYDDRLCRPAVFNDDMAELFSKNPSDPICQNNERR